MSITQKRMTEMVTMLEPVIEKIVATKLKNTKIPESKQWFTINNCAEYLSVSEDHIRAWIDEGTLDGRMINLANDPTRKHLRITRESLVQLLNDERRKVV